MAIDLTLTYSLVCDSCLGERFSPDCSEYTGGLSGLQVLGFGMAWRLANDIPNISILPHLKRQIVA